MLCRCGRETAEIHPCHWGAYTCTAPGAPRFDAYVACVAGAQPKLGARETWACDEHWEQYKALRA